MNKLLMSLIVLQFASMCMNLFDDKKIENALKDAGAQGRDTFAAKQVCDLFSSSKTEFTMVNGWKAVSTPNQCSVNLVRSDSGIPYADSSGFLFDLHPPARRFVIKDCSKLPPRIFEPFVIR